MRQSGPNLIKMGIHGIFDNRRNWICQLGHKSCVRFWDICLLKNFIQIGFVKKLGIIILLMMMKCSLLRREYVCLCGPPGQFIAFARTHLFYWIFRCLLDELFFCDVISFFVPFFRASRHSRRSLVLFLVFWW